MYKIFILGALLSFASGEAGGKNKPKVIDGKKVTYGQFLGVEQGDYMHLQIRDDRGQTKSFWCLDEACRPVESIEDQKKLVGKKVRIHWRKVKKFLEPAGEDVELELVTKIEFIK